MAGVARRVPLIKFPVRRGTGASSGSGDFKPPTDAPSGEGTRRANSSGVPAAVRNSGTGGSASIQPKRAPISKAEIEAVLLGGLY